MYLDETEYPLSERDVIKRIERYVNTSADELNAHKMMELLEECGIHVERGWHGHKDGYFIPVLADVDAENDFIYEQWADGLGEDEGEVY